MPIKVNLTEIEEKVNHGRRQKEEIEKSQREQKLKIDSYSKYVREMYWPKVSAQKQLELEHIRTTLKN